ncbi:MAG: Eco57I restriction-modification methylase domain-containing protein [Clostridiales bacterium]|nr:Eco57I restriction-modification methylase domain-containing protein [Clostridiales bacterium]
MAALEMKLDLLDLHYVEMTKDRIQKVTATIKGNNLNIDSASITKIRLLLCVLHRYGVSKTEGLAKIMNDCFTSYDFVSAKPDAEKKYDIVIGNPPYVEDSKSESVPIVKYGNIYANVLENAALHLKNGGVLGFVIPLSYVSTPRMKKIRKALYTHIAEQYILSYSDRPDCLFTSAHQKLCILFGRNIETVQSIYTGNYRYWYKEERSKLFNSAEVIKNEFVVDDFIPKLGNKTDSNIYKKISEYKIRLMEMLEKDNTPIYLNMRAAFWIKAFLIPHRGSEYKEFRCKNQDYANFCMCLLNSSLFWWYWVCISDCWHITKKELNGFKVPEITDFQITNKLADVLEQKLEDTKKYIGTKQTDYEYKHKECVDVIHEIDDYINDL